MIIGLDLDNTIINYGGLFRSLALARGFIGAEAPYDKAYVRDRVRRDFGDRAWQQLQAEAYGPAMAGAEIYPGVEKALRAFRTMGMKIIIISHKTLLSGLGGHNLRRAALEFLEDRAIISLVDDIIFTDGRDEKVRRIRESGCRVFVDDLPEVVLHPLFPASCERILFNPRGCAAEGLTVCPDWAAVEKAAALAAAKNASL